MDAMGGRAARRGFTFEAYVPTSIADQSFCSTPKSPPRPSTPSGLPRAERGAPEPANLRRWRASSCGPRRSPRRGSRG